jgi:hypothetical protein
MGLIYCIYISVYVVSDITAAPPYLELECVMSVARQQNGRKFKIRQVSLKPDWRMMSLPLSLYRYGTDSTASQHHTSLPCVLPCLLQSSTNTRQTTI